MSLQEATAGKTPPPRLALGRLASALYLTCSLSPQEYEGWASDPNFDAFFSFKDDFLAEEDGGYYRSSRENLTLQISGLVIATYWMDVYPGPGIPRREFVENLFRRARFPEDQVVSPLVLACAEDKDSQFSDEQRTSIRSITSLATLAQCMDEYDPAPRNPGDPFIGAREIPINRTHVASAIQPRVAELGELLLAEHHTPNDWSYYEQICSQIDEL